MRSGQALGLRHSDFVTHEQRIEIVARKDNANRARGKRGEGSVPASLQERVRGRLDDSQVLREEAEALKHELALAYGQQRHVDGG